MKFKFLFAPTFLSAAVYLSGCSGIGSDVLAGRNALQSGRPNDAIGFFSRAAATDPNYRTLNRVPEGVLTFLGRAYYESGRDDEARQTLEKAVVVNGDDPLAHLYLGLALLRNGDRERGRKEIEGGLRGINDTLEYIAMDRVFGFYWDPGMQIRKAINSTLASKLDSQELAMAAQWIGTEFDVEIDRARRDESRSRGGGGGGGGGD
jgi:tetratricopeptide (TPR) repeat protein